MAVICFAFEQLICGFPVVGALSDSWTVATESLPDAITYVEQTSLGCFYEVSLSVREVDMHKIKRSGPVKGAFQSIHCASNVPRYCTTQLPHFLFAFFTSSSFKSHTRTSFNHDEK